MEGFLFRCSIVAHSNQLVKYHRCMYNIYTQVQKSFKNMDVEGKSWKQGNPLSNPIKDTIKSLLFFTTDWCLRMATPEPLPQRATCHSRRLRGQQPLPLPSPVRVVGSVTMPPPSPSLHSSGKGLHMIVLYPW